MCLKQAASLKEHCGPLSCQLWLRAGLVEAQLFSGGISPVQHTALFPNDLSALAQGQDGSGGGGGCALFFQARKMPRLHRDTQVEVLSWHGHYCEMLTEWSE